MIIILSPAKSLDFKSTVPHPTFTLPDYLSKAETIAAKLRKLKPKKLKELLEISSELAELNFQRYQTWHKADDPVNARQAVFAYKGDVYVGLDAYSFTMQDLEFAYSHLRIISGLYGILRPTDLIMPHRLEMGTSIKIGKANDLYSFWKTTITQNIKQAISEHPANTIINLASVEYSKSIDFKKINAKLISPVFKDFSNGEYKLISFFAKKARGMMASYIIRNKITDASQLKAFTQEGYYYNNNLSTEDKPVFTRD
jgi:uncharacterized protein